MKTQTASFRKTAWLAALLPALAQSAPPASPAALPSAAQAAQSPRKPVSATAAAPGARAAKPGLPTVAIDVGRKPKAAQATPAGKGQTVAGAAEFAYNQRFADQLARELLAQGVAVKRIPAGLAPAQRAKAAAGATLLVSVNHEVLPTGQKPPSASSYSGYTLAVSRQQAVGRPLALGCARQVAMALLGAGRYQSLLHTSGPNQPPRGIEVRPWADMALGVQAQDDLPLLKLAPVPALRLQVAVLANPSEVRRVQDAAWTGKQARAAAKGLAACLATSQASV